MANLLHSKGSRTQIYTTLPSNSVGNDGDIILAQIQGRGVYLCSKVNGKWHVSTKMEELRKIEKTSIKDLKLDRLKVGTTTITKDEYDVSVGDFTLDVAGNILLTPSTDVKSDSPLKIKEASNAVADTAAYGQLWVKTATPNQLYFTTDAGDDIQITSGTATAFVGDITGVTITTDSGGGSAASDTSGSADFSILGSSGVGVTNSGTTITAVAVPGEIDHDSLNNFASNEHFTQANITTVGTIDTGTWEGTTIAVDQGGTGATNSNAWLNSRITTNADGSLNYDATGATAVNHDSLTGFVSNEHIDWTGSSAGTIHSTNYSNTMGSGFTVSATTDSNATTITQGDDLMFTAGTGITCETTADGTVTIANTVSDTNTTYSAGSLLDLSTTTFNVDLTEAAEAAIADGDYILFLDGGATGSHAKEAVADLATLFAGTSLTASSSVIGVDDDFIKNDAADIMEVSDFGAVAALKIDADQPATAGAEDSKGLWIDYDRIVAASGTAAHNDIGIDLDVNTASLGTSSVIGMDIDVVGATSGTHTAIGIDLDVDSADTNIGMIINTAGTHLKLVANADADDYATFTLADTGDLTIATVGDGTTDSDLTLDADGDILMDAAGGDITITSADVSIAATKKIYLDGNGGHTYISENSADNMRFVVGGDTMINFTEGGSAGNVVNYAGSTIVTIPIVETFSDDSIIGSGGTHDTHIDFRTGQKAKLSLTADITTMNLIFPSDICANFVLICDTDGDHDVTNWKVFEGDASAASGDADVLWAGGSVPAFTSSGIDIVSFVWDGVAQKCYGVASLDFDN